jgi:hypothetical protein
MRSESFIKTDKNNEYFTQRSMNIYDNISSNYSQNAKFSKLHRNSKHTFYIQQFPPPLPKKIEEIKLKNMVEPGGYRRQYGACAMHAG